MFAVKQILEINGKQKFYKLIVDKKCGLDEFWDEHSKDKLMKKQLILIQTRMGYISDMKYKHLDPTKYKELSGRKKNDPYKDYEIKTKNLRLYFFKDEGTGQIVVLGGNKATQKKDISKMRTIKLKYFKSKKQ